MGTDFALYFCSFSLSIFVRSCSFCVKKTKQLMLFIFYPIRKIIWWWTGCACVYVRRVNDGEACVGRATENGLNLLLCVFYSLSSSWGTGWFRMYRYKKQVIVSFKKKRETLERYLLPPSQPNICQPFRRAACKRWAQQGSEVSLDPRVTVQVYLGVPATNRWLSFNLFLTKMFVSERGQHC